MTTWINRSRARIKNYKRDTSGQFAVWFSVAAFPVLVATSLAVDHRGAESSGAGVKHALDAAVLAAVSNDRVTAPEKKRIAQEIFSSHYRGDMDLKLNVLVRDGEVEMSAEGHKEATIAKSVGFEGFKVNETSIARMNRENTICVLALAKTGKAKLRFLGATEFNSPTCSVQSNSVDTGGAVSTSKYPPIAKSFCSSGGAAGDFKPAMRGECRVIDDPYATRKAPQAGVCMPDNIFAGSGKKALFSETGGFGSFGGRSLLQTLVGLAMNWHEKDIAITWNGLKHEHYHCHLDDPNKCHVSNHDIWDLHAPRAELRLEKLGVSAQEISRLEQDYGKEQLLIAESVNYTTSNSVYSPGTYCGGLTVDGANVTFLPGTYIIKDGPLTFKNKSQAVANDVSFVLTGKDAIVTVESGSYVTIKAPKNGPMAGLAFFQDRHGDSGQKAPGIMASRPLMMSLDGAAPQGEPDDGPTGVNLISSGGELNVTGTMYFPTQALDVTGNSVLGAKAPATSFIAHQVTFAGKTKAQVAVDHVKGRIPPMLPRSDDGARLIK